jgi:diguanylate cyclase (GGDEF)-like protein
MSLLLLDLDRFKEVNDALGHQIGDQLLQQVGQRLESILRDSDTIARLGGDEFAIVAPNTDAAQARKFADKVAAAINRVFFIQQQNLYVGVSIGVATYPDHGNDAMTLVRHADVAMYVAKRNNLDVFIYERQRDDHSLDRLALVGDLHDELKDPQHLQIYYQPLIDLLSREVVAIEALLRWNHPQMGFISPENIINMAEHTGLIGPLTQWVINTALRDCAECHFPSHNINISINLSAWNLQDPQLPSVIRSALDTYGQTASKLTLEITESAMMNDPVRARDVLSKLSDMGIDLAIDDFGTGFSSLGYLKMLPVDCLKIDKSFVIDMLENENDAIIVHSTIELAHNLGLQVIAEGVENQETLLRLRRLKCDLAQGYHISKPVPRDQFQKWLKNYNPKLAQSVQ